jgi:hypothetical protein
MSNVSFFSQKSFSSASVSLVSQCQPRQPVSAPSASVSPVSQKVILSAVSGFADESKKSVAIIKEMLRY